VPVHIHTLKVGIFVRLVGMKATVSEKGQVTVPKPLRERLDIRPGDELDFSEEGGRLVALKSTRQDPVDAVYGSVNLGRSTNEIIRELRGDAEPG
jgi:antitoxin PrlF